MPSYDNLGHRTMRDLVWDRLPMTIGFMRLLTALLAGACQRLNWSMALRATPGS